MRARAFLSIASSICKRALQKPEDKCGSIYTTTTSLSRLSFLVLSHCLTMNLRKLFIVHLRRKIKTLKKVRGTDLRPLKVYQCSNCTKKYGDLGQFYMHRQNCSTTSSESTSCPVCNKVLAPKSIQQHLRLHDTPKYLCQLCGSSFSQLPGLWLHINQAHQRRRTFKCRFCEQTCRNQPQLWNHEWSHKNPQGIECDQCKKVFSAPNLLQNHRSRVHRKNPKMDTGQKVQFSCTECDHSFSSKQQLERHSVKHSKEKPFHVSNLVGDLTF